MKTLTYISRGLIFAAALTLAACGGAGSGASASQATSAGASGAIKRYPMHGKIISVNAADKSARIDAGPIGDWMGAMTMDYPIRDAAELSKLTAGSTIDATVFVQGDDSWVGDIKTSK